MSPTSPSFAPLSISTEEDHEDHETAVTPQPQHQHQRPTTRTRTVMIDGQERPGYWKTTYRGGFSTSICALFDDPYERSSCCALTCCGTFLQDRNSFLLTGEKPPAWWIRILGYIGGFILAAFIPPFGPVLFIIGMAVRATLLRQQLRLKLQQKMFMEQQQQQQQQQQNSGTTEQQQQQNSGTTEHQQQQAYYSSRSEHWCCACVSNDKRRVLVVTDQDQDQDNNDSLDEQEWRELERRQKADFCFHLWKCLSNCCCNVCCFSYWNWCGMCATAQEDRQLKQLLPNTAFLRDYITFQPFAQYYPQIQSLRYDQEQEQDNNDNTNATTTTFWDHINTLSELSSKLLKILLSTLFLLLAAATFHLLNNFRLSKVIIIAATLFQAFVILYIVYWRNHRHDISLDAIIKLFASGFVLAMSVALLVELILSIIGTLVFDFIITEEFLQDHPELEYYNDADNDNYRDKMVNDATVMKAMAKKHFPTLLVFLFFKSVIVAALVEEMTKYFCFWMVEHPDFIYGNGNGNGNGNTWEQVELEGGFTSTTTSPDATTNANTTSTSTNTINTPPTSPSEAATTNLPPFHPRPTPTHSTAGAIITVGMIATAVGFSCSENLVYVFSQGSIAGEIIVLFMRSLMPVHSICAAIQSIGVVRRDVELDRDYQIGWALLPAILLHGFFDFALYTIAFVQFLTAPPQQTPTVDPSNNDNGNGNDIYDDEVTWKNQGPGLVAGGIITALGIAYYVVEAGNQRGRLKALEMTNNEIPTTVGVFA